MENFDSEALSDGLRLGDQDNLRSLEAQMMISVDSMNLGDVEVLYCINNYNLSAIICAASREYYLSSEHWS